MAEFNPEAYAGGQQGGGGFDPASYAGVAEQPSATLRQQRIATPAGPMWTDGNSTHLQNMDVENAFNRAKVGQRFKYGDTTALKTDENSFEWEPVAKAETEEDRRARGTDITRALTTSAAMSFLPGAGGMVGAGRAFRALGANAGGLSRLLVPAAGGAVGSMGTAVVQREALNALEPRLAELPEAAQSAEPLAAAIGNLAGGNAPYQKLGFSGPIATELRQRALGGGIGAGIGAVTGGAEGAVGGAVGGVMFNDPTDLGRAAFNKGAGAIPVVKPKNDAITSKLGNASTKDNYTESLAASNDIALTPSDIPGAPAAYEGAGNFNVPPVVRPPLATLEPGASTPVDQPTNRKKPTRRKPTLEHPGFGATPDEAITPIEVNTAGEEVQLKTPMEPEMGADAAPRQAEEQNAFNDRVLRAVQNLAKEGVDIDRQTAVKLARITNPEEFNRARQQLIDSTKTAQPEIPTKGPIKSLGELPAKVGADDAEVVDQPEVAPVKATEAAPTQESDRARYDQIQKEMSAVVENAKATGQMDQDAMMRLWTENETIKNRHGGMPPGEKSGGIDYEAVAAQNLQDAEAAIARGKAESAKSDARIEAAKAKAREGLTPESIAEDKLAPAAPKKPAKRVSIEDVDAIEAEAAAQAQKPVKAKETAPEAIATEYNGKAYEKRGGKWYEQGSDKPKGKLASDILDAQVKPKGGVQKAGNKGIVYNPFDTGSAAQQLSQINRVNYIARGDGTYDVQGFSEGGIRSARPSKYGKVETPVLNFSGDEAKMREVLGDAVSDEIIKDTNAQIFEKGDRITAGGLEKLAEGSIAGIDSFDFKSKFGTQAGSVANPFDGEASALGKAALDTVNEPLLRRMAKADVDASRQQDAFNSFAGKPIVEEQPEPTKFPEPGTGRAQPKKELKSLKEVKYEDGLLPTRDSITGEPVKENIEANAKAIYERLVKEADANGTDKPSQDAVAAIGDAPEEYVPLLTDLAGRFPRAFGNPLVKPFADGIGGMAKFFRQKLGLSADNIGDVYKPAQGLLYQRAHFIGRLTNRLIEETKDLGQLTRKNLSKAEYEAYRDATLGDDRDAVMAIFKGKPNEKELVAAFDRNQAAKAEARQLLIEAGRDVGEVDTYFQRQLLDRDGLREALGKGKSSGWKDVLAEATNSKGSNLTEDEKVNLMNQYVLGTRRGQGGPSFLKERKVEITPGLSSFYEDPDVADIGWAKKVANDVGNRKFFGKIEPNDAGTFTDDSSFGRLVAEGVASGAIRDRGLTQIQKNLTDLYNNQKSYDETVVALGKGIRQAQTFAYLADISTALVQFADITSILRRYGRYGLQAYGKGMPKVEDIGVTEGHNVDVEALSRRGKTNQSYLGKAKDLALAPYRMAMDKLVGKADEIQKSASTRAAMKAIAGEINKPESSFFKKIDKEYSRLYPDRWEAMKDSIRSKDFANGKLDENSSLFLFTELSKLQPIHEGERAQGYHTASPLLKPMYGLRSYWLKQVGILRNEAYNEAKRGNFAKASASLGTYLALVAVGQQAFQYTKDKILDRKVADEEYAVGGMLQLAGVPRYALFRGKQLGYGTAAMETLYPGLGTLNDIGRDVIAVGRQLNGMEPKEGSMFKSLESTKYIPGVGREVYAYAGKGKAKEDAARIRELEGQAPRKTTLQELSSIFDPPADDR